MSSKDDPGENLLNDKSCRNATEKTAATQAPVFANARFPRQVPPGMELRLSGKCSAYWAILPALLMVTESPSCLYMQLMHQG